MASFAPCTPSTTGSSCAHQPCTTAQGWVLRGASGTGELREGQEEGRFPGQLLETARGSLTSSRASCAGLGSKEGLKIGAVSVQGATVSAAAALESSAAGWSTACGQRRPGCSGSVNLCSWSCRNACLLV